MQKCIRYLYAQNTGGVYLRKTKAAQAASPEDVRIQTFLDMIAPSVIKFETDHFICGNTYRCVWALREYPTATDEQAILSHLGEKDGVTLRIYTRHVTPVEEKKIISNAANKNRMDRSNTNDLQQTVQAESNLQDVATIVAQMHRNREPLLHTAVYLELCAHDLDQLKLLQTEVLTELIRSKLNVDRLMLRQQQGFQCVMPTGFNLFRDQFERVLPASSVANLYPFNYSGKTDPHGFYIGRDKFGSNVLVDFNRRADDKTNANILILGNSGQGKSYLLKLLLTNMREAGMKVCALDPEMEYEDLTNNLGGCFIDLMSGEYLINPLEPKIWDDAGSPEDMEAPQTFRIRARLSQHISFLKDFFRTYKDFSDREIDVIEIMLQKLYAGWGMTDQTDFTRLGPQEYPVLADYPLEPKIWDDAGSPEDMEAPQTFRIRARLSQHISFLKDFFRTYKDFSDREIDVIEIMLQKLYAGWGMTDQTDFTRLGPQEYPVLADLYTLIEKEYKEFDEKKRQLYTAEMLQSILLGLNSMCVGSESKFFNGHTNITDSSFVTFGVKGLLQASRSLKDSLLFNTLSFMSNELLTEGNTVASLDEFYLFLSNLTAVEYVRNFEKRVRKKDSAVIIASQNLEDFNLEGVREYTKPLFSIPTHQFLFNAGSIDAKFYTDTLQLEDSEYNLIRYPQRGVCLYKCGNERYNLMVHAPEHKAKLFGKAGGR